MFGNWLKLLPYFVKKYVVGSYGTEKYVINALFLAELALRSWSCFLGSVDAFFFSAESMLIPDIERGMIGLKLIFWSFDGACWLGSDDLIAGFSGTGKSRLKSGGSFAYLPIERPRPSKSGTVALQRIIGGITFDSLLFFTMFVNTPSTSTCVVIISSLLSGQQTLISDNSVFKQKLNFSATGTPKIFIFVRIFIEIYAEDSGNANKKIACPNFVGLNTLYN